MDCFFGVILSGKVDARLMPIVMNSESDFKACGLACMDCGELPCLRFLFSKGSPCFIDSGNRSNIVYEPVSVPDGSNI